MKVEIKMLKHIPLLVSGLLLCIFLVFWQLNQPVKLVFDLKMEQDCFLLIYYAGKGKHFKNQDFVQQTVTASREHHYEFSLPSWTRQVRLVPGRIPGNQLTIRNFALSRNGFLFSKHDFITAADLRNSHQIVADGNGFKTTGRESYLDFSPKLTRHLPLNIYRILLCLLLPLLVSLLLLKAERNNWTYLFDDLIARVKLLQNYCSGNRIFLIYMFGCLILFFGYELFIAPISLDDDWYLLSVFEHTENNMPGAYSTVAYNTLADNYFSHGRWAAALMTKVFTGFSPVVSLFWSLICFSIVFLMLAEKLKLPRETRYLLFPLFIAHPVYYENLAFYMTNNVGGFLFLINFLIVLYWRNAKTLLGYFLLFLVSVFNISSMQSLIVLFPLWFLLEKTSDCLDRPIEYRPLFTDLLKLCGFCLLILLGYFLSLKFEFWMFNIQWQYLGNYIRKPDSLQMFLEFGQSLLQKILTVFSGRFEFRIHGQLLLILLMSGSILVRLFRKKRGILGIAMLAVILILPFSLDIASFNTDIPVRSMNSFPVMLAGLCMLGWRALETCPRIRIAAGMLIVYVAVQYGILMNQKAYASNLRHEQDMAILQSIKDRCYQIPEFTAALNSKKKIPLAVVGNLMTPEYRSFPMWNDSMLNCTFEPAVVINLHLLGETYFYPAPTKKMRQILPTAMAMPSWPAPDSVRYQDGIMIVKFSGFTADQCSQYGFPLSSVTSDNSIFRLRTRLTTGKPVWTLNKETLDSLDSCTVNFTSFGIIVKSSGWHSLYTKAIHADRKELYCLQIDLPKIDKDCYLFITFIDPTRQNEKKLASIKISGKDDRCCVIVPGSDLNGTICFGLGDLPGKEQVFKQIALFKCKWEDFFKK